MVVKYLIIFLIVFLMIYGFYIIADESERCLDMGGEYVRTLAGTYKCVGEEYR